MQIGYGPSTILLSDRIKYPYFLRTNPDDSLQTYFMTELLKELDNAPGGSVKAVNVIYSGLYGRSAAEVSEIVIESRTHGCYSRLRINS